MNLNGLNMSNNVFIRESVWCIRDSRFGVYWLTDWRLISRRSGARFLYLGARLSFCWGHMPLTVLESSNFPRTVVRTSGTDSGGQNFHPGHGTSNTSNTETNKNAALGPNSYWELFCIIFYYMYHCLTNCFIYSVLYLRHIYIFRSYIFLEVHRN